jgi:hypothetical protein
MSALNRMTELLILYREANGILTARKMAKEQTIREAIDALCEEEMTVDEKIDMIITVLELMNMKVD